MRFGYFLKKSIATQLLKFERLQFYLDPRRRKIDWQFLGDLQEIGSTYMHSRLDLDLKNYTKITSTLLKARKDFKTSVNTYYFQTLQSYSDYRLRFNTKYGFGIGKYFDLNPTYICFLDYVVKKKISGNVIDFATGLGGFLPYLEKHIVRKIFTR